MPNTVTVRNLTRQALIDNEGLVHVKVGINHMVRVEMTGEDKYKCWCTGQVMAVTFDTIAQCKEYINIMRRDV